MKCSIVNRADPKCLVLRLEAETSDERVDVEELQKLDRSDTLSPIASFGGSMVEVKVLRTMSQ